MKYASAAALDRAITDILLRQVGGDARRYQQLRREVAFERVLARLVAEDPEMWLLKGGVALDYRLREARSTLDLDLSSSVDITAFQEKLVRATAIDLGDFFDVQLSGEPSRPVDEVETYRFGLDVRLNNRTFMKVSIDVDFADPWLGDADALEISEVAATVCAAKKIGTKYALGLYLSGSRSWTRTNDPLIKRRRRPRTAVSPSASGASELGSGIGVRFAGRWRARRCQRSACPNSQSLRIADATNLWTSHADA